MRSPDEQLLAELQAPPDLSDGVESLEYWRDRSKRLSWYRIRARREARLMTERWERRVRAALLSQRGVPVGSRVSAALLLARIRLQRLRIGTVVVAMGVTAVATMILPVVVVVLLLTHIF
jgi:hypothetical protein